MRRCPLLSTGHVLYLVQANELEILVFREIIRSFGLEHLKERRGWYDLIKLRDRMQNHEPRTVSF